MPGHHAERLDVGEELLRQRVDHEGEPALAPLPVGTQQPGLQASVHDHVQQVVVGEPAAVRGEREHHGLQDCGGDRGRERLRRGVDHQVDPPAAELREPLVRDRRGDERLPGEVLQAEAAQLVVRRDHHVGVPCRLASQRMTDELAGGVDLGLHRAWQPAKRPQPDVGGQVEQRVAVQQAGHTQAQQGVGELEVLGELAQDPGGAVVVEPAQDDGPGVGEEPWHVGLHLPDRPLLEHVVQRVPAGDGDVHGGRLDLLDGLQLAVVQPGGPGLAEAGHRNRRGLLGPLVHQSLGGGDVSVGAEPQDAELVVQEGHVLVVVTVGSGQADVHDQVGGGGGHRGSFENRLRSSGWRRTRGARA